MWKSAVACLIVMTAPVAGNATSYLIQPDGTGDFPTIQDALFAAAAGDTILLADGTFTGSGNRNLHFVGKSLVVRSQSGTPNTCTIDCQGAARAFTLVSVPSTAKIAGITITGGIGDGAAIYCENTFLTIENCLLVNNGVLDRGGGVHCRSNSHPVIRRCTLTGNQASSGGGIWCYSAGADVIDTVIEYNVAHSVGGGGVWMNVTASVSLTGCTIRANTAVNHGGGVWCGGSVVTPSTLTITDCDISGNGAQLAGGMFANSSFVTLSNTVLSGNRATGTDGGGAYIASSNPTLTQVTLAGNHAAGNGGGAYLYSTHATFDHCILWGDCADAMHDEVSMGGSGSSVTFLCCDAPPAEVGGAGSVSFDADSFEADPLFCGAEDCSLAPIATGDYRLDAASPAAPPASVTCGLIGALDVGCSVTSAPAPAPTDRLTSRAVPNPATGRTRILFSAPAGPAQVTLYDARGRVVRQWSEAHAGGPGSVTWDARDGSGRPVRAGVYFYRLSVAGGTSSGRVVRLTE